MKKKILTTFLIVFFTTIILNINNVFGIGYVSQAWVNNTDGTKNLYFRVSTSPSTALLNSYHKKVNGQNIGGTTLSNDYKIDTTETYKYVYGEEQYNSKWMVGVPEQKIEYSYKPGNYMAIGLGFHKTMLTKYGDSGNMRVGYISFKDETQATYEISGITQMINDAEIGYRNVTGQNSTEFFCSFDAFEGTEKTITQSDYNLTYGNNTYINNTNNRKRLEPVGELSKTDNYPLIFREAILTIGGKNVLIGDYKISGSMLNNFIVAASEEGVTNTCYVSTILASPARYYANKKVMDFYEVSRTLYEFLTQENQEYWMWESGGIAVNTEKEKAAKGLGSPANLYDNQLILPQFANRKVKVRYINLGTDTDKKANTTYEIIEDKTEYVKNITEAIKETRKTTFDNKKYKGYNIQYSTSYNNAINDMRNKKGIEYTNTTCEISGKGINVMNDEYILIDFYYTEFDKNIKVNHWLLDGNNNVVQTEDKTEVQSSRTVTKRLGIALDIEIGTVPSGYTYVGYDTLTGTVNKEYFDKGKNKVTVDGTTDKVTVKANGKDTDGNDVKQVNFYYKVNRIVTVRHINLGNNTTVTTSTLKNKKPFDTITSTVNSEETVSKNAKTASTYKCIGYNIGTGTSEQGAISSITNVDKGEYVTGTTAKINGAGLALDQTHIVIDFYYTEFDKQVIVNHLYVDEDGYILSKDKQTIKPNDTATMKNNTTGDSTTINRINTDSKVKEVYNKKLGTTVTALVANSLKTKIENGTVEYLGYTRTSEISWEDMVGTSAPGTDSTGSYVTKYDNRALITQGTQVNLFYRIKNTTVKTAPDKTISGNMFITLNMNKSKVNTLGKCNDGEYEVISVPTGSYVNIGIENAPKFMVAAIKQKRVTRKYVVNVNFKNGKTASYSGVASYNVITDMALYKLNTVTMYDGGTNYDIGVVGKSMFKGWNEKNIYDGSSKNLTTTLYGIDNKVIDNNSEDINNVENYIKLTAGNSKYVKSVESEIVDNVLVYTIDYNANKGDNHSNLTKLMNAVQIDVKVSDMKVAVDGTVIISPKTKTTTRGNLDVSTAAYNISTNIYDGKNKNGNYISKLTKSDYDQDGIQVQTNAVNGVRWLVGRVKYTPVVVIGNSSAGKIKDNTRFEDGTFNIGTGAINKYYKVDNTKTNTRDKYKEVVPVNVYTPITVDATMQARNTQIIDQSVGKDLSKTTIQINTPFTINLYNNVSERTYGLANTNAFNGAFYVKFDFDVYKVSRNGTVYKNGDIIRAGTWIGPITKSNGQAYITAQAYGKGNNILSQDNRSYTVRAVANNYNFEENYSSIETSSTLNNICNLTSYYDEKEYEVSVINRAYDFRVTDVKDVSWKNVFRTNTSHKGIAYYAGLTKWNNSMTQINNITERTTSEIGGNPLRILPIGPYKNTNNSYVSAPKLGYRFAFDMKVTGKITDDKKVEIQTKFYYISKDGKTYYKEYDDKSEGIYLFYKTSAGKYVRIDNNGGGYNLTFTPNDGYRYITGVDKDTLASTSVSLGNLRKITLKKNMSAASTDNSYITYYGEYKLPNSTIAVKVDKNGKYDINKPLTNGYIGVVFDITAISDNGTKLSYSKNTKDNTPNTSQWDYEGFLGYKGYGSKVKTGEVSLKLEKGNWIITDEIYNQIKGSVILYDIDQRASTDYE